MASFHLAGNETMIGLFVKKELIRRNKEQNAMVQFLRNELGTKGMDNRYDFMMNCDGAEVFAMVHDDCVEDEEYLFVTLFKLSINVGLLNTKFDDSLEMVTDRYIQQIIDTLRPKQREVMVIKYWSNPYWNCGPRKATVRRQI